MVWYRLGTCLEHGLVHNLVLGLEYRVIHGQIHGLGYALVCGLVSDFLHGLDLVQSPVHSLVHDVVLSDRALDCCTNLKRNNFDNILSGTIQLDRN